MKDVEILTDKNQIKVLLEPTRADIIFKHLIHEPMTVKQLSTVLGKNPGTILHHIDKLKAVKLVVEERTEQTVTGIVQRYYRATAREYRLGIGDMMRGDGQVAKFTKARLKSMIKSLAFFGIEIPESQFGEAMELLRSLIDRENKNLSELIVINKEGYRILPGSVKQDASRIMRRLTLDDDPEYKKLREEWHRFLRIHRKGGMNNE